MKTYKIKKLIDGKIFKFASPIVAVPDKDLWTGTTYDDGKPFRIDYKGSQMVIKNWREALEFRKFQDKRGRGTYTLGYFFWKEGD